MNQPFSRRPGRGGRVWWAAALLVAGCLVLVFTLRNHGNLETFPPVSIATIDGRRLDAATVAGGPVLFTFWSTTCVVCLQEMPDLEALYRRLAPRGFEIVAVSMPWDPPDEVVRLAQARALPYPVALDVTGAIAQAFGNVSVTPTHILIDPGGEVAFHRTGALDFAALDDRLRSML
ncbi:MAG: TlpA disulfide reductase family protein [Thiotrichales bacterium]|nr:TlpA disulfide reductase family protein [Thiotrichales bacterium]MCY4285079.1 TlpA disulfide reductase family protein [Thiotrichales bacterium]MCY4348804.1 TlpA disulfide reductase family protein [Thiotrichales bacterium]